MFAPVLHRNLLPVLQIKKRRHEDECDSSTESEDILFFGEDAAVLHTRPRKIRRLRGSIPHKPSPVHVPLATLVSASLQRGCSTSSAMEGVVDAPFVAPNSHGQTPADTDACEPTSQDWWFQDGDVVLAAGSMVFKLHSTVLAARSGVFADLFALGRPEANEEASSMGAPTIPVHDNANDWLEVLPWLYYGLDHFQAQPLQFPKLRSCILLATKYDMIALRDWALTAIETIYPPSLTPLATARTPDTNAAFIYAVDALALARQCDVPSILPAVFYCLSTIRWRYNEDGGRGHAILDPVDIRRMIVGRESLQDASMRLATTMSLPHSLLPSTLVKSLAESGLSRPPSLPVLERFCVGPSPCRDAVAKEWMRVFVGADTCYRPQSILRSLSELSVNPESKLCVRCAQEHLENTRRQTEIVVKAIPGWFGL